MINKKRKGYTKQKLSKQDSFCFLYELRSNGTICNPLREKYVEMEEMLV